MSNLNRKAIRSKVRCRIRKKISGTADRPRLAVHYSNKNIYAQLINDVDAVTLLSVSTLSNDFKETGSNIANSSLLGSMFAKKIIESKVENVVFDRGGFLFHGKVKSFADAARKEGLNF